MSRSLAVLLFCAATAVSSGAAAAEPQFNIKNTPYITTAHQFLTAEQLAAEPWAGSLLATEPGSRDCQSRCSPADDRHTHIGGYR